MEALRTLLAELELGVHAEYVSQHFRHTPPAVPGAWLPAATALPAAPKAAQSEVEAAGAQTEQVSQAAQRLAWLPATVAAVSLRLAAFDAAVVYVPGVPPARDTLQVCLSPLSTSCTPTGASRNVSSCSCQDSQDVCYFQRAGCTCCALG